MPNYVPVQRIQYNPQRPKEWALHLACGHTVFTNSFSKPRVKESTCPRCDDAAIGGAR